MSVRKIPSGISIDMDAIRAKHEKQAALGNMGVNAKGEKIVNGKVVESNVKRNRVQVTTSVENVSVSSILDDTLGELENEHPTEMKSPKVPAKKVSKKIIERELDNGDIEHDVDGDE